jgi:hypothetical protein
MQVAHSCCSIGKVENIAAGWLIFNFFFLPLSKLNTSYLFIYVQTHQQKYQIHDMLISPGNMQVQNPHNIKYNGTIQGLKYIWRTEGFRGLFKGNGTNCARIVPNSAVKFFSYEQASK